MPKQAKEKVFLVDLFEDEAVQRKKLMQQKFILGDFNIAPEATQLIGNLRKTNKKLNQLFIKINTLRAYAKRISGLENHPSELTKDKAEAIQLIATKIEKRLKDFISGMSMIAGDLTKEDQETALSMLKKDTQLDLQEAEKILQTHQGKHAKFRIIVENILIALTGVGLLALIGKAIYAKVTNKKGDDSQKLNKFAFFGETASEKKVEEVNDFVASTKLSTFAQGA